MIKKLLNYLVYPDKKNVLLYLRIRNKNKVISISYSKLQSYLELNITFEFQ